MSFGRIRPVYANKKSYIQYADGNSGKGLLLVNIEASATAHHKELCKTIFEWVVENPCTKEDVVAWKTTKFRRGGSQKFLRLKLKSQIGQLSEGLRFRVVDLLRIPPMSSSDHGASSSAHEIIGS